MVYWYVSSDSFSIRGLSLGYVLGLGGGVLRSFGIFVEDLCGRGDGIFEICGEVSEGPNLVFVGSGCGFESVDLVCRGCLGSCGLR